jgi:hypothetical protein
MPTAPLLPMTTGSATSLLKVTESQLTETVRRGLVQPPPPILAGRRLWHRPHLLQAAQALNILTDELRAQLGEEVA